MPVAQPIIQRRMRPEVSTLIRNTTYNKLADHGSVEDLPDVVGLRHNVFWMDHDNLESAPGFNAQNDASTNASRGLERKLNGLGLVIVTIDQYYTLHRQDLAPAQMPPHASSASSLMLGANA